MKKYVVRLRVKELMKAQIDKDITTDKDLADLLNVNVTQVWRTKLPITHEKYNTPGNQFIAGVMEVFGGRFDDFFYIEEVDDPRKTKQRATA
ncbi:hypothetical protein M5X02_29890 [Paenibacillus alvei]|uniref:HTH cro/C1-type domain-containing protein n=1 Tax=Paenibacillus alvei TaxID=44250 RepID=A0A383RN07_PAEAL|nr:hypothetical protein [Paenibacillus alvei]EJW19052.1 hypothetical protein PAV_1c00230 [Paenibacillus alvei DSM 29]MCY9544842.1 hypothetical protein [Paenibacillus alvei]MCY9708657.1 hypothetical protein [Paenibacillus alvei]MEC0084598.1 hypothetical protein [Paenibacillus alvei]SYX85944.1 conserved protein of unknown function [Paenibacillus alvei]